MTVNYTIRCRIITARFGDLFTGWQSVAAYNYGRPHVGYQALMANSLLTYSNALGYVTELLSGDFNAPFGRSSHHQIWSEAMVVSPVLRGMLGLEISNAGKSLKFAPQIPANWNDLTVQNIRAGDSSVDFALKRGNGKMTIFVNRKNGTLSNIILSPSFPLDAVIKNVTANGKKIAFQMKIFGDVQQAEIALDISNTPTEIAFDYAEGTDVYLIPNDLQAGQENTNLKIIRSSAQKDGLHLTVEGRGDQRNILNVKSTRGVKAGSDVMILSAAPSEQTMQIVFSGGKEFTIREIIMPFASDIIQKGTKK